ncbi:TPA: hypothetical protein ACGR33_003510 [Escherichia coli]
MVIVHIVSIVCNLIQIAVCLFFIALIVKSLIPPKRIKKHPAQERAVKVAEKLRDEMEMTIMKMNKPYFRNDDKD